MTATTSNAPVSATGKRARTRFANRLVRTLLALCLVVGLTPAVALADAAQATQDDQATQSGQSLDPIASAQSAETVASEQPGPADSAQSAEPALQPEADGSSDPAAPSDSMQQPESDNAPASTPTDSADADQPADASDAAQPAESPSPESPSNAAANTVTASNGPIELAATDTRTDPNINVGSYVLELTEDSSGTKFYQWGSAAPVAYTGTITLRSANGNSRIVVKGSHDIVLGEEHFDNTIASPGDGNPAIDFQVASGKSSSSSTLILADDSATVLKGGKEAPAVNVAEDVALTIKGGGTLNATGSDYCAAIGVSGASNNDFGSLSLDHTGTITAQGGSNAPALGDPNSNQSLATGSIIFNSGTATLNAGSNFPNDLMAGFIQVYGGNIHLSHRQPVMYQGYAEDEFENTEVVGVNIAGLPAGSKLTQLSFKMDGKTLPAGYFCLQFNPRTGGYVVNGFDTIEAGRSIVIFFTRGLAKDGAVMSVKANGSTYEGMLVASGTTGGYNVRLASRESLTDKNPVINVGKIKDDIVFRDQKQYSVDGGGSWRFYEGSVTLTGAQENELNVYCRSGAHEVNLRDLTLGEASFIIEGSAAVNLALAGINSITANAHHPAISFRGARASLTISGKGSLEAITKGDSAAIGSENATACDHATLTIKGGTVVAKSAGGPGIGSGIGHSEERRCSLGTISIQGGSVTAKGDTNRSLYTAYSAGIGSGPGHHSQVNNISITGGTVTAGAETGAGIGASIDGKVGSLSISGGNVTAYSGSRQGMPGIGGIVESTGWGSCGSLTISGGTINASGGYIRSLTSLIRVEAIKSSKTTITGGTINGQAAKAQSATKGLALTEDGSGLMALSLAQGQAEDAVSALADSDAGESADAVVDNPVNELGEDLVPVVFSGLPADTSLSSVDFSIVNIDLVDDPVKGTDYGVRDVTTSPEGTLTFYLTPGEAYKRLVLASWGGQTYAGSIEQGEGGAMTCALAKTDALLFYEGHTFEGGWQCEDDGIAWSTDGASTEAKGGGDLTALRFETPLEGVTVRYAADNGSGFGSWAEDGDIAGEMEEPIQSLRVNLAGDAAAGRSVTYRALLSDGNWTPWAADGEGTAMTQGAVAKAVQAKIVPSDQLAADSGAGQAPGGLAQTGDAGAMRAMAALICAMLAAAVLIVSRRAQHRHS